MSRVDAAVRVLNPGHVHVDVAVPIAVLAALDDPPSPLEVASRMRCAGVEPVVDDAGAGRERNIDWHTAWW